MQTPRLTSGSPAEAAAREPSLAVYSEGEGQKIPQVSSGADIIL